MNVLLVDNNAEALEKVRLELSGLTGEDRGRSVGNVAACVADVSKLEEWDRIKANTERWGSIELLFLNAGVTRKGTWGDDEYFRSVSLLLHID